MFLVTLFYDNNALHITFSPHGSKIVRRHCAIIKFIGIKIADKAIRLITSPPADWSAADKLGNDKIQRPNFETYGI